MTERHTWSQTTIAHLLPGALAFAFYVPASRLAARAGLPDSLALFAAMLVVLVPSELGALLQARKTGGTREVIPYRNRLPALQYVAIVPLLLAWAFFCFFRLAPHEEHWVATQLFAWPPAGLLGAAHTPPTREALLGTWAFGLLVNGLMLPIVEELYFRGYLLPRIPLSSRWSPLVNAALFSLYHFFSPGQNLTRTVAVAPIAYAVSWKRSVSVGIATHCLLNTIAMSLALPSLLAAH